jgi:hypothetical protein
MPGPDYPALAEEAVEIWTDFRALADARGATVLMARVHGVVGQREPVVFPFHVDGKGHWLRPEIRTLSTGKRVVIVRAEMKDAGRFFIDYVTDIPVRDVCALGPEVDAVWQSFKQTAEELGATKGFVSPSEIPVGGQTIAFSFSQAGDRWSRSELCQK